MIILSNYHLSLFTREIKNPMIKDPILTLAFKLRSGTVSSRELAEQAIDAIKNPEGQGNSVYTYLNEKETLAQADNCDRLLKAGNGCSLLTGIPLSVKDLFDVQGQVTRAGSTVLSDCLPAERDSVVVHTLRNAGAVFTGRTNLSEFAFSGLGINETTGTPLAPWNRSEKCIPGGSSSGAAVSVSDGMAVAAIGTDTGGSIRIPAALCNLTGFKPTARRVSLEGVLPLSPSLDSFGSIGHTVSCCAVIDKILSGEPWSGETDINPGELHIGILDGIVNENMDPAIASAYSYALSKLSSARIKLTHVSFKGYELISRLKAPGFPPIEAYHWHRDLMKTHRGQYSDQVLTRLELGRHISAADYLELLRLRKEFITKAESCWSEFDAIIMPTVPILPPTLEQLKSPDVASKMSSLLLRNTSFINYLDGCAVTIPSAVQELPVGIMITATAMADNKILSIAGTLEKILRPEICTREC